MKPVTVIAKVFAQLAAAGEAIETTAGGILRAVKAAKITTEEAFEALVKAAYDVNKWHSTQGKPKADSDRRAIPPTVRTYVWEVRAALREGLPVGSYRTFYDLRIARRKLRASSAGEPAAAAPAATNGHTAEFPVDVAQDLQGVRVAGPEKATGALFHDLVVTFIALPTESRLMFSRQLTRLMHTYQRKAAQPLLALPAPAVVKPKKAASG